MVGFLVKITKEKKYYENKNIFKEQALAEVQPKSER